MTSDTFTATEGATSGGSGNGGDGGGNRYSQRSSLPSPWAQVVRGGGETDPVASRSPTASPSSVLTEQNLEVPDQLTVMEPQSEATAVETQPEGSESSSNGNAGGVKKSAWNKPSANGVVEGSNTPVMGAASWPALSELTRPLPKSLSFPPEPSSKPTSDGVIVSQAPAILQQPQRPVRNNANHHSNQNHMRQRSMRRGGSVGGGYNWPQQPPTPPPMPPPYPFYDMSYCGFVPTLLDSPVREQSSYNGSNFVPRPIGGGVGSHSHAVHDHPSNRKRNNFGTRPHGDGGPYLNNGHGGRRDHQDRDWRGPRSHAAIPPQMVPPPPPPPRGYLPQAHMGPPAPFMAPTPIRPYGTTIGYEMAPPFLYLPPVPPDPYRGAPLPRATSPIVNPPVSVVNTPLSVKILNQIEYYFSDANLVKDEFLRSYMDEEGWVPITLVAGFRRVQSLTSDVPMILNCLRDSTIVEIKGETVRRRNEWGKYLKLTDSSSQSPHATIDSSAEEASMLNLSLDDLTTVERSTTDANDTHNDVEVADDSSKLANGEVISNESANP